jgi:hypothetical protein
MSNPRFPDVPFAVGVPSVLRTLAAPGLPINSAANIAIGAAQSQLSGVISNVQNSATGPINGAFGQLPSQLTSDSPQVINITMANKGQWGIFDQNNNLILSPDSFNALAYRQGWRIANYPMEQGAFQSYNKVQTPFNVRVTLNKGGTDEDRTNFLQQATLVAGSFDLFNVVTPEYVYTNVSIESYDYQRTNTQGAKLLSIDFDLIEVRLANQATFTNTATASGANPVNNGIVQTQPATPAQQANASLVQ